MKSKVSVGWVITTPRGDVYRPEASEWAQRRGHYSKPAKVYRTKNIAQSYSPPEHLAKEVFYEVES